jgi:ribosomal protein L37E
MMESYLVLDLADSGRAIRCLLCGTTSYNPNDIRHRYCGFCHVFHEDVNTYQGGANHEDTDSSRWFYGEP